ncbi:CPBP family intramembrane glutamic endopeptidase [Halobacillus seohaensis]|uniref:CPBP family intramembrane glutamic endopeptidase n=1 Tax=Halobacillus seohaensis TaxID=447421 RepID=A0ABW2EI25_9BACI
MPSKNQSEIIQQMSTKEVTLHLIFTQLVLLLIAVVLSLFLFDQPIVEWGLLLSYTVDEWLLYGVVPGLIVVSVDFLLIFLLPERFYDDGGINKKVFENQTIVKIILLTLVIAICEEALFRGIIQTQFGYMVASTIFALIHFRYLKKIVLFLSVIFVSYFIGYMFEVTGSLVVSITAHFMIDSILGVWIYLRNEEAN